MRCFRGQQCLERSLPGGVHPRDEGREALPGHGRTGEELVQTYLIKVDPSRNSGIPLPGFIPVLDRQAVQDRELDVLTSKVRRSEPVWGSRRKGRWGSRCREIPARCKFPVSAFRGPENRRDLRAEKIGTGMAKADAWPPNACSKSSMAHARHSCSSACNG